MYTKLLLVCIGLLLVSAVYAQESQASGLLITVIQDLKKLLAVLPIVNLLTPLLFPILDLVEKLLIALL